MKKVILILIGIGLTFVSCQNSELSPDEKEKYKAELTKYANEYMSGLKDVLIKNMQEGGPYQAVSVCSDTASDLTTAFNQKYNVIIQRVSAKNRNVNNTPDEFESEALSFFSELKKEGKLTRETSYLKKANTENDEQILFAKPILVEAPCLNCHGSNTQISNEVSEFLTKKYPDDKAKGYEIGDLRGLISVTKSL